jgi:putative Mg2+ transporter-C (MgtC) family protein
MRTHGLVACGAAMLAGAYRCAAVHRGSNVDPMRVAAQAAAGVGFIGGGAILKEARRSAVWSCTTSSATSRARGSGSSHRSRCAPPQASSSARA